MDITPETIRKLVELAFVIEPLLDKADCTTRFQDIPGKTIYDFVISGLNVGCVFEEYAKSVLYENNNQLLSHFEEAVRISNEYKNPKLINIGLLEFMFVTVKARLTSSNLEENLTNLKETVKKTTNVDVQNQYEVFVNALGTSQKDKKKNSWISTYRKLLSSTNLYDYYVRAEQAFPDKETANYQVPHQYVAGFPILREYATNIDENIGLIKSIETTYNKLHSKHPEIKIGILADFSAAAVFLYLSWQNPSTYVLY